MDYTRELCEAVRGEVKGRGALVQPDTNRRIGYLVASTHVRCASCEGAYDQPDQERTVPLFSVNIDRYSQHCHECGIRLVGESKGWPELFTTAACRTCTQEVS